ncbi:MAG: glycosyltransferase, partial [Flavobacteriales bacterium]
PTPWVSFSKIFGLSRFFPKSKKFNQYYLGHLSAEETHEIEILSGAFMMMRKTALDKVGLLDEAFFMYGEDIDLSWRIILGGFKNYYYPHTRIIHYKGESTKKGSLNYVFVFYQAMIIFAKKHFSAQHAKTFTFFINMAIYLRAGVAIVNRFVQRIWQPALDFLIIFLGLWFAKDYYAEYTGKVYDFMLSRWAFASYTIIWMLSVLYSGGYDRPIRLLRTITGTLVGTGIILVVYALMPESLRFSRALILFGAGIASLWFLLSRWLFHSLFKGKHTFKGHTSKRFALVGSMEEIDRIQHLLRQTSFDPPFAVKVSPESINNTEYVGSLNQLKEIIRVHRINEVVFSGKDLESKTIIDQMSDLDHRSLDFKIAPAESLSLIGSNSIDSSGDLFILDTNSIIKPANQRNKRTFDVLICLLTLAILPVVLVFQKQPLRFIKNWFGVALGRKTWVGYEAMNEGRLRLPKIKKGVLSVSDGLLNLPKDPGVGVKLNMVYARNYKVGKDLKTLLSSWRNLGA